MSVRFTLPALAALAFVLGGCATSEKSTAVVRNPADIAPKFWKGATSQEVAAVEALIEDLSKKIQVVEKEFLIFHYAPGYQIKPTVSPTKASDPKGWDYFRSKADKFFSNQHHSTMMGNGLYLASDPSATYQYGKGTNFLLLRVAVQKGFRVLDAYRFSDGLRQSTKDLLRNIGCRYYDFELWSVNPECAKYLKLALHSLDIALLEYPYDSSLFCENRRSAFVAIDSDHFSASDVSILLPEADYQDEATRKAIETTLALVRLSENQSYIQNSGEEYFPDWMRRLYPDGMPKLSEVEGRALRDLHVFSCPKIADHLLPLSKFSDRKKRKATNATVGWVERNAGLSNAGVFCEKRMIDVLEVASKGSDGALKVENDWKGNLRDFCNGGSHCSFSRVYGYGLKNGDERITVRWDCLPKSGEVEPYSKSFDLATTDIIEFECPCEGTKKNRERQFEKREKKPKIGSGHH
jgi:hypothetical protein